MYKWLGRLCLLAAAVPLMSVASAGCGGGSGGTPTPAATVTVTAAPSPSEAATTLPHLTLDEQRVYQFVSENFPKLRTVRAGVAQAVKEVGRRDWIDATYEVKHYTKRFNAISDEWLSLFASGGAVYQLEQDFTFYRRAIRRYGDNVAAWALYGGGSAKEYANALLRVKKYEPRVQADLNDIAGHFAVPTPQATTSF